MKFKNENKKINEYRNISEIKLKELRTENKMSQKQGGEKVANKPIFKVTGDDVIKYLEILKKYSASIIK